MDGVSGFTFIHNGVEGGYPFVEAIKAVQPHVDEMVVVDMQSTDETRYVLEQLDVRIIDGIWTPGAAGECLKAAHARHTQCENEIIWHFEADEVFDELFARGLGDSIQKGMYREGIAIHRIQVEQNFQRVRWYPEEVHRIFWKGHVEKCGHTTSLHSAEYYSKYSRNNMSHVAMEYGLLWDVTNCFRDDWLQRVRNQAELWGSAPQYKAVGLHAAEGFYTISDVKHFLRGRRWTTHNSPFALPKSLSNLVGVTSYREHLKEMGLL